jgi:hypothetical protein
MIKNIFLRNVPYMFLCLLLVSAGALSIGMAGVLAGVKIIQVAPAVTILVAPVTYYAVCCGVDLLRLRRTTASAR